MHMAECINPVDTYYVVCCDYQTHASSPIITIGAVLRLAVAA